MIELTPQVVLVAKAKRFALAKHAGQMYGNAFNNEFDNLRIICPNCHTQIDTFTGRNVK